MHLPTDPGWPNDTPWRTVPSRPGRLQSARRVTATTELGSLTLFFMSMLGDTATCQEKCHRFLERTIGSGEAWILSNSSGAADCDSDDYEESSVIPFFSEAPCARRGQAVFRGH